MNELIQLLISWLPHLLAMLLLTVASGFFSSSETAIFCLSPDELRDFRSGNRREQTVVGLLSDPDRLLTAILFWNLTINMSYFAVGVVLTQGFASSGHSGWAALFGLVSLIWIIVLGEVLPKSGAVAFRKLLATTFCIPLSFAVRALDPVMPLFSATTRGSRRLFWPGIYQEPDLTADDLEQAIDNSEATTEVIVQERQILHNTLDLGEITCELSMRPRGTYLTLPAPISLSDIRGSEVSTEFVAVSNTEATAIESIIPLASFSEIPESDLHLKAEEVIHVPWCADLAFTLQQLRDNYCRVASVVNEYGETIGIITHDDIIENVLFSQASRAERVLNRDPILKVAENRYHVDGMTSLRYLSRQLNANYEPQADDAVTVAGLLQEHFERLPDLGDECCWCGLRIKVIEVTRRSRLRAMVWKELTE